MNKSNDIPHTGAGGQNGSTGDGDAEMSIRHILVVDDEDSVRTLLAKALAKEGFDCYEADNGETALDLFFSQDVPDFDLVISDISMPGMDGMDLLKKLKSVNPEIDVIIMTGYAAQYSYVDIMDAGASDYMTKPFNINSTLARIKRIAREKRYLIDLRAANEKLRRAMERANTLAREADDASKAKTFFLAAMSHEIRTPLNGIVGYTDMLMDTRLDDEQKSFLARAKFSCNALLSVVNDILDFSKVESGKLRLDRVAFDPEVLCFDSIDAIRTQVDEAKVDLLCRISDTVPPKILGDPHRFRQVLLNLLGNAVKFTIHGSISLELDARTVEQGRTFITAAVSDTGIGIDPENLEAIFEPFVQSETDITRRHGGTGLGLAISRDIARKMGGDLRVSSQKNKGSVFSFTAMFETGDYIRQDRVHPADLQGKRILIAAADEESSHILVHTLSGAEVKTDVCSLDALQRNAGMDRKNDPESVGYDLVVLDFGKLIRPEATDIFKIMGGRLPDDFPVGMIACAVPFPGIARILNDAGFKGFLPKPVRRALLLEMAAHLMGTTGARDTQNREILTAHSLSETTKSNAAVLLVEDNPVNQHMTRLMLTRAGYRVKVAGDGREGLDVYCKSPGEYDLVLMDINMPVMDGFETTRKMRDHEAEKGLDPVPVLALSANVLTEFRQRGRAVGMNDFLAKPVKREQVFSAIRKWARKTGPDRPV